MTSEIYQLAPVEDLFAEDDRVAARISFTGTQDQPFFGVEPTGQKITVTEIAVYRIKYDKVAEMWLEADLLGDVPADRGG